MDRIRQDGETFHAVERDGALRRATGDLQKKEASYTRCKRMVVTNHRREPKASGGRHWGWGPSAK